MPTEENSWTGFKMLPTALHIVNYMCYTCDVDCISTNTYFFVVSS